MTDQTSQSETGLDRNHRLSEALVALKAIDLIVQEKKAEEIAETLKELPPKIYLRVIFKDPKWIAASGRISKASAGWIRKMQKIKIHPLLGVKKGIIKPVGIKIGGPDLEILQNFQH